MNSECFLGAEATLGSAAKYKLFTALRSAPASGGAWWINGDIYYGATLFRGRRMIVDFKNNNPGSGLS